ncbi:MAG: hypothetical protein PUC30_07880 [Lachnospiraceae bacterium]|nr:hypothetical protein [Lachnospiraceae bacterium]
MEAEVFVQCEKAAGEGSLFHEGSININKGFYSVKDLGESLTHLYSISSVDKMQLKKYKEIKKQNKEIVRMHIVEGEVKTHKDGCLCGF